MLTGHFKMPPIESNTQFQSDVPLQPLNQQQQNLLPTMGKSKKNFSYSSLVAAARSRRAPPPSPRPPPPSPRPSSPARSTVVKSSKTPTTTNTKTTNTSSNSIVSYNDSFLCYVHDENLAGPAHSPLKRFRALVQVGSDAMRIIHHPPPPPPPPLLDRKGKKEKETKASKRFKAAPFPYLLKPGIGLVHDVSYRGVELLQRHKNQFTFNGVRAPITIQLACLEDTERMRRLLTGLYKAKGHLSGDHHQALSPSSTFRHHTLPLPVFALVSEWQLAEVLDQCSLKLFRWSNQSYGGGGGAPEVAGRSAWLMEFWINRHFVQDALAPASFCPRSFDAWQHDQQILLKALVKVARIVRLHLEEKRSSGGAASTLGRNQRQQQLVNSLESSKLKSLTAAAVERLCSGGEENEKDENQEEEEEESELLQSSEEYPEEFNPFAADGGGGGKNSEDHVVFQKSHLLNSWSEGETKWATMSAGKQVFDCIRHRFIKLIRKCSIVFTTKEQKKSET